ncbi:MAG TPA: pyridoxamine 5'-phosphate oxidase family protein [Candidatus Saccharimonadales bacterium]|nr:pyridoxamine 5'-phosphate oxidase family protein [Candidatus Saccharimonadales bacterium]
MTVGISESREQLLDFLKNNNVGVLATTSNAGVPHAATVYITFDQDLNIYFVTRKGTRKSQNIHANTQAALAIYNAAAQTTLQAEGTAIEVIEPAKIQWVFNDIWRIATQTSPNSPSPQTQLMGAGEYIAYKLSTPSLRLATFKDQGSMNPEQIFNVVPTQEETHFNAFDKNVN